MALARRELQEGDDHRLRHGALPLVVHLLADAARLLHAQAAQAGGQELLRPAPAQERGRGPRPRPRPPPHGLHRAQDREDDNAHSHLRRAGVSLLQDRERLLIRRAGEAEGRAQGRRGAGPEQDGLWLGPHRRQQRARPAGFAAGRAAGGGLFRGAPRPQAGAGDGAAAEAPGAARGGARRADARAPYLATLWRRQDGLAGRLCLRRRPRGERRGGCAR
mmetsp:Transcript_301/g.1057  ORF Transcript_301/g.1057 Transcript_301/m.1057 type:complete len:219 (-) Transcript_301:1763-2419(-)